MVKRRFTVRKRKQNRLGMIMVIMVIVMMTAVVAYNGRELRAKKEAYAQQEQELQKQIDEEKARTEQLAEYKKYTKTKKFAEEVAKDKLGLVYDGEIIFQSEE